MSAELGADFGGSGHRAGCWVDLEHSAQPQAACRKTDMDFSNYVLETTKNAWNAQKSGSIYMNQVPKS